MANGHGGDRVPANPAPVSGPGSMSQRTDGQAARYMSGGPYGEGQELMDLQTSAPMEKAPAVAKPRMGRGGAPAQDASASVVPLFAPTQRPDEPVTAGAPFGPGPGPSPTASRPSQAAPPVVAKYLPYLEEATRWPDAPDTFKALVRYLQGAR